MSINLTNISLASSLKALISLLALFLFDVFIRCFLLDTLLDLLKSPSFLVRSILKLSLFYGTSYAYLSTLY